MARYTLRRPTPAKVSSNRVRRQGSATSGTGVDGQESKEEEEEEEEEGEEEKDTKGPESPDSLASSSDEGGMSSSDDSDSEDEEEDPPSPVDSDAAATSGSALPQVGGIGVIATASQARAVQSSISPSPSGNNAAVPQTTGTPSSAGRLSVHTTTASTWSGATQASNSNSSPLAGLPPASAQSDTQGNKSPQRSAQQQDAPILTQSAAIAATVLGVLGALVLAIGGVVLIKHRKRKQQRYQQHVPADAFDPGNANSLHIPETAHVGVEPAPLFGRMGQATTTHLTHFPILAPHPPLPTPNPFADPPLNKAYDVLAGRPRSTTLTDRGSWLGNPFRNPESERFDPFGELKEKARQERVRQWEKTRREAESGAVEGKERMDLMPDDIPCRKRSGVTLEGVGILDRSAANGTFC